MDLEKNKNKQYPTKLNNNFIKFYTFIKNNYS